MSDIPSDLDAAQQEIRDLRQALESRSVIDQAKGIVRAWLCCDEDEAWEALVRTSQAKNVKVRLLAAQLVDLASSCQDDVDDWLEEHVGRRGDGAPQTAVG